MRTRYAFDAESGLLVDREGNSLGRVVSITLDSSGGGSGGGLSLSSTAVRTTELKEGSAEGNQRPTATQLEAEAIERIWAYYLELIPSKRKLDTKRRRIIRNALALVGEDATKRALLGLSRSPFHSGENEQRRKFLELRYALKGIGDESDDERIEKAISWAAMYSPNGAGSVDPDKVERWLDDVRTFIARQASNSKATTGRDRAVDAWRKLAAVGITVVKLDKAPWARMR